MNYSNARKPCWLQIALSFVLWSFAIWCLAFVAFAAPYACPAKLTASLFKNDSCIDAWQQELMARVGCDVTWLEYIPIRRKLELLKNGKLDFAFGLTRTKEREKFGNFTNDIISHYYSIVAHKESKALNITSWCDDVMKDSDVILPLGSVINEDIDALSKNSTCVKRVIYAPLSSYQAAAMVKKSALILHLFPMSCGIEKL